MLSSLLVLIRNYIGRRAGRHRGRPGIGQRVYPCCRFSGHGPADTLRFHVRTGGKEGGGAGRNRGRYAFRPGIDLRPVKTDRKRGRRVGRSAGRIRRVAALQTFGQVVESVTVTVHLQRICAQVEFLGIGQPVAVRVLGTVAGAVAVRIPAARVKAHAHLEPVPHPVAVKVLQ